MIIALIGTVLFFIKVLELLYFFQIKEYRFDRFWSLLREEGIIQTVYTKHPRFPAKKLHNLLIVGVNIPIAYLLYLDLVTTPIMFQLTILIFVPIIALLGVTLGVMTTAPIVYIYRQTLIVKAKKKIAQSKAKFIIISGTYGKTSVKEFLFQLLSTKYQVAKTDRNMNTDVGVALSILKNLKDDTEYFITEVGAYRLGEVDRVCRLIHPTYGILTSKGNQHVDLFGSINNLAEAEAEFIVYLPQDGALYVNKNAADKSLLKETSAKTYIFAQDKDADIFPTDIKTTAKSIMATVQHKQSAIKVHAPLIGEHNLINLLPCIGLALDVGMSVEEVEKAIKELKQVTGKLSFHKSTLENAEILNDASNSCLEGFIAAIKTANRFTHSKKIIVSKGIIELGSQKEDSYRQILDELAKTDIELLTTDKLFKIMGTERRVVLCKDEVQLLAEITKRLGEKTLIVLEGKYTNNFISKIIVNG
ncbi:MAG: UDP-N-acetylmuramoyl-tripeptide--D-alanyl-D-alanine ligase [Patescibacteria group bacterium]